MAFPRLLLMTGSAGHGHVKASQALAAAVRQRHPAVDVADVDALARMPRWYASTYRNGYLSMVDRHPMVWRHFYESNDRTPTAVGHALSVFAGRRLVAESLAWKPDLVVCTHFLAPELFAAAARKGGTRVPPIHVVITDHDVHRIWWYPEVEQYYVPSEVVKARLSYRFGTPAARIHVTGIPIGAAFTAKRDPAPVRARLGLDPARPVVLFLSGGFAGGPMEQAIQGVWVDRPDAQIIAVCGKNARLERRLAALPRPAGGMLLPMGFRDDVPDLMTVADLVVSKSGGLSTSECMALGRPMVISAAIPGQEERNADAVAAAGAGVKALTPEEVRWHVARLLARPDELRVMALRAKAFGRPHAAEEIADHVAERLGIGPAWAPPAHGARAAAPRQA